MQPRSRDRRIAPAFLTTLLWAAGLLAGLATSPNIVLILTDDQGWSQLSRRMDPRIAASKSDYLHTPNMNRLMTEGMRFTSGYAPASLCTPTRRSILCGSSAARSGTEFASPWVPSQQMTIPKALKLADPSYVCGHFGKWGEQMNSTPEECGYDASDGLTGNVTGIYLDPNGSPTPPDYIIDNVDPKLSSSVTSRAIQFMEDETANGNPFYVQISYYAQHLTVVCSQAMLDKYNLKGSPDRSYTASWGGMLEELDIAVGDILDAIAGPDVDSNTYVFFTSDNGGSPNIPGGNASSDPTNHPLTGFKGRVEEGGIRVPFIVSGPGITGGGVCHTPVVGYDFLPTFYDLAGGDLVNQPLPDDVDGFSIKPLLLDPSATLGRPDDAIYFHRDFFSKSAIRQGDYKLLVTWDSNGDIASRSLYDLSENPIEEGRDIAGANIALADAMEADLLAYFESLIPDPSTEGVTFVDGDFWPLDETINNTTNTPVDRWYLPTGDRGESAGDSVQVVGGSLETGFATDLTDSRFNSSSVLLDPTGSTVYRLSLDIDQQSTGNNDYGIRLTVGTNRGDESAFFAYLDGQTWKRADDTQPGFTTVSFTLDGSTIAAQGLTQGVDNFLSLRIIHFADNDEWLVDNLRIEVIPLVLGMSPGATPGTYDFNWRTQSGKVYDLVSSTDLVTDPAGWSVWQGQSGLTTGSITGVTGGGDPRRFFAVVERNP